MGPLPDWEGLGEASWAREWGHFGLAGLAGPAISWTSLHEFPDGPIYAGKTSIFDRKPAFPSVFWDFFHFGRGFLGLFGLKNQSVAL